MTADARFLDPDGHAEALARLASEHLSRGDHAAAFRYADRRCRLFKPSARDYLLRSEASRRAGFTEFATDDLALALDVDPTEPAARELALLWGTEAQKRLAARAILADGASGPEIARRALALLFNQGARVLFSLARVEARLSGWVAWRTSGALSLRVESAEEQRLPVAPDPSHELAGEGWLCAGLEAVDPEGDIRRLAFLLDGVEAGAFSPPTPHVSQARAIPAAPAVTAACGDLTVIVPVYEDYDATRACLEAVFAECAGAPATRLIVVDDASPNARLRTWLQVQAALRKFRLLRNERNLGFAASVNRALDLCPRGDVLLLNADALPPPSCFGRLAEAARADASIGTVTPLSNNGEYTSFPEPFVVNPLGSAQDVARLDALARRAHGAASVELPNGVGFCLYITRACLDAVGPLPEIYARGYYEDVEFCLRARERGFRNVCAVGVYVGHAGSRSFGQEKKRLVRRNQRVLDLRFPDSSLESAAFLHADPLRAARGAVEALAPVAGRVALLVCGEGVADVLAQEEAERRAQAGDGAVALICRVAASESHVELRGAAGAGPHSLAFSLRDKRGVAALRGWLGALDLERIEIFDPLHPPEVLLKELRRTERPIERLFAGPEWPSPAPPFADPCRDSAGSAPCAACAATFDGAPAPQADRALDRMAQACLNRNVDVLPELAAPPSIRPAPRAIAGGGALAVIAPSPSAPSDRAIVALGRALARRRADARVIVFGACVNDLAAMASGHVFVAGKVSPDEYARLFRQYDVGALMSPHRTRFFGRLDRLAASFALPKVWFDWSFGALAPSEGDLALDPRLCDAKAAERVAGWLAGDGIGSNRR